MENKEKSTGEENINQSGINVDVSQEGTTHRESHHHSGHHHSGHHHSSHHHHGEHSHSSGHTRSKKKKIKFGKKFKLIFSVSLFALILAIIVVLEVASLYNKKIETPESNGVNSDILIVEVVNEAGVLVNNAVYKYLLTDLINSYNSDVLPSKFLSSGERVDEQVPVSLKLSLKEGNAVSYKVELADNSEFVGARVFYVDSPYGICKLDHLYVNAEYFYRVTAHTYDGVKIQTGTFKTSDTPRILSIDGLSNVRDIGNWRTDSGKRIKQGLLIRGTEMDGAVESGYHLTNDGLKDMLDVFGIKTDIDLRAQTTTSMDALGSRVEHRYYDMVKYSGIFTSEGKEKIRMVFSDLANPDIYPIYLHCTYGCDRTGTVCYLLEALLGVSRGDCLKDYGLSNLYISNIKLVENGLMDYEGNTLKEQVEAYLLSCGVTEHQIESIRNIFLGD